MENEELNLPMPIYDDKVIENRYAELAQYKITIPGDMMKLGYIGINDLFAQIQAMLDRVNGLYSEAMKWASMAQAASSATKYAYEAKYAALISSKTKEQFESIKILEATVDHELASNIKLMQRAKLVYGLFSAYLKSVEGSYKNLESARKTLEMQANNFKRQNPLPLPYNSGLGSV